MRKAEEAAFDVISPIITGGAPLLTMSDMEKIALFGAIVFSMIDRTHLPTSGINQQERAHIYQTKQLPANWKMFIGLTDSPEWTFRFRHHGGTLTAKSTVGRPIENNFAVCTIGLGSMVLHAISDPIGANRFDPQTYASAAGLALISESGNGFVLSSLPVLSTEQVLIVADTLVLKGFKDAVDFLCGL